MALTSGVEVPARHAALAAYVAAAANLAAGLAMLLLLRPGLAVPGASVEARLEFVRGHLAAWRIGWLVWHLAAIALLAFLVGLASRLRASAPILSRLAPLCAAAGLAADLGAQSISMGVSPTLDAARFEIVESASSVLTGYLGNGLYTLAGAMLTWAGRRELPRGLVGLGAVAWAAGFGLSAASLVGSPRGQMVSTAVLMPAFVLWTALVGRWLSRAPVQ